MKELFIVAITFALSFAAIPKAIAQLPQSTILTLPALESMALEHHPTLARVSARVNAVRGKWLQSGLYPNPEIGYDSKQIGNFGTPGQHGIIARQTIVTAGKLRRNREIAQAEIDRAVHQYEASKLRVLSDVRIRFYDVLTAQRRLQLAQELVRIGDDAAKASAKLNEARLVGLNDVLQSKIEADTAIILLGKARNRHRESWQRLSAAMGLPAFGPTPVAGDLAEAAPRYKWDATLTFLMQHSPEMAAAHANVERARAKLQRECVEPIPNVNVLVSGRHNTINNDEVANVIVTIPVPIFNRNQGNIRTAKAELAAAISDVRRVELELQNRLAIAFRRYADAKLEVDTYRDRIIPNARKSLDLVKKGYKNGQINYVTYLVSQRTFFKVNLTYLDALQKLRESTAIIRGQLLTGGLSAQPSGSAATRLDFGRMRSR